MSELADLFGSNNGEYGRDRTFSGIGNFVQGVVSDNAKTNFEGKIKVEFTGWEKSKNICEWIPLLSPYAGKGYGSYLVPEVGDIVLVGFIGAGEKRPFVLGCLFPVDAQFSSDNYTDKNDKKHLKTKGGIDVLLSDEKDKQAVTVTTPKGLKMTFSDENECISMTDKKGENILKIDSKKGQMTLTAKSKIALKAGKSEITMDGASGAINIKCTQLKLEADKSELTGNQMLTLSGGVFKAEGKQLMQLSGGTLTEVKGGIVKIN